MKKLVGRKEKCTRRKEGEKRNFAGRRKGKEER